MRMISRTHLVALALLWTLPACKKELPEHERQLQAQKKKAKERRKLVKAGKAGILSKAQQGQTHHDHDHADHDHPKPMPLEDMDDTKWPRPVKKSLYALVKSPVQKVPNAIKRLAHHGPAAFEAMRFFLQVKRQPKAKRAAVALMLAELNSFRPEELAKMGAQPDRPFLQRAAIELLGRHKHPLQQKLLAELRQKEKPMAVFIDQASTQKGLSFDPAQLKQLDGILNAPDAATAKRRVAAINNFDLESGLIIIMGMRGARPLVQGLVAKQLVLLAATGDRGRLRRYAETKRLPPMMRVAAAQILMSSKDPADKALIEKMAKDLKDPMSRILRRMAGSRP